MRSRLLLPAIVTIILVILVVLFVSFDHLRREREDELSRLTDAGDDDLARTLRLEAEAYRIENRNTQIGIAVVACVIVLVALLWWVTQRGRGTE